MDIYGKTRTKGQILALVKGLVTGAVAKIHMNGLFSEPIPILQGFRQGAPLLFAISTKPLLSRLATALIHNTELGVKIIDNLQVCHRLFANDVGIFILAIENAFSNSRQHLTLYKKASGARS
jgi:hypothetical protein